MPRKANAPPRHPLNLRTTATLRAMLEAAAQTSGRSLTQEATARLARSFDQDAAFGDPEMRHGRKTRTKLFTGYKRHVIKLIDADVIVGAVVRPANEPSVEQCGFPPFASAPTAARYPSTTS